MSGCRVFITYAAADAGQAERLRRALNRAAASDPSIQIGPVILDEATNEAPSRGARLAVEAADRLVAICSPAAAKSARVNTLVMTFKRKGRGPRVIPVVLAGEPWASRFEGIGEEECLCPALRYATDAAGLLTDHVVHPDIVDLRAGARAFPSAARIIIARALEVSAAGLHATARRRRRRHGFAWGAAAAAALTGLMLSPVAQDDAARAARAAQAEAAALEAHAALDRGAEAAALSRLAEIFPQGFDFEQPSFPVPKSALLALNRAALETRTAAEVSAGGPVARLRLLEEGAVAAVSPDGAIRLVDLGAGEAAQTFAPDAPRRHRASANGATLFTARFGPEAKDDGGEPYQPLYFEDVALATGAVEARAAVRSVPAEGGAAAISPKGALFAVDIGPGLGDETIIAVFERRKQALAGIARAPSDRASIRFVDEERLLIEVDPPSAFEAAPGFSLWDVSAHQHHILRATGLPPVCEGQRGAARAIRAAMGNRLTRADWTLDTAGAHLALLLPSLRGGACLQRWSVATGRPLPRIAISEPAKEIVFVTPRGIAGLATDDGLALFTPTGRKLAALEGCSEKARWFETEGGPIVFCFGERATTIHHGLSGGRYWRGAPFAAVDAVYDPERRRIIAAAADGRIRVYDAAPRGWTVDLSDSLAQLTADGEGRIAATATGGRTVVYSDDGRKIASDQRAPRSPLIVANAALATAGAAPECEKGAAGTATLSPSAGLRGTAEPSGVTVIDLETCLPVRHIPITDGAAPFFTSENEIWVPRPGAIEAFALSIPPETALAAVRARIGRFSD